jgi:hypothetical protein
MTAPAGGTPGRKSPFENPRVTGSRWGRGFRRIHDGAGAFGAGQARRPTPLITLWLAGCREAVTPGSLTQYVPANTLNEWC